MTLTVAARTDPAAVLVPQQAGLEANMMEIGALARELGVAPSTLRTWERRYRLVVPRRGPAGQRLYDAEQILVLRRVLAQVRRGARARVAHDSEALAQPLARLGLDLPARPDAPQHARRAIDELLASHDDRRLAFNLRLVASELVKNAVQQGSGTRALRLEVALFAGGAEVMLDNREGRQRLRALSARRRDSARGLEIVDALAESWAIECGASGTKITVRLALDDAT
jgi:DNA-binding transcriptional MerR regulator